MSAQCLMQDTSFWLQRRQAEEAETNYYARLSGSSIQTCESTQAHSLASEIAKAREQIRQSLNAQDTVASSGDSSNLLSRLIQVEEENKELRKVTTSLHAAVKSLENRIKALEVGSTAGKTAAPPPSASAAADDESDDDADDDFDLFGEDDDEATEEAERIKAERIKAYTEKKSTKPKVVAKSNIILDIKPWDDETDMKEMERLVRTIEMDGLLWGSSKLVPVGYGIKKLQISTVVEDDKVSTDDLEDKITAFEDYIQSMDIAAFNKI